MNQKLYRLAGRLQPAGVTLLLWAALRADGGLSFWLAPALLGLGCCTMSLTLRWLCSPQGLAFRRKLSGFCPIPAPPPPPCAVICSCKKAG